MNCKEALPLIHEYLDGDLQGSDSQRLKEHLISCQACHALFRQLEKTDAMVRMLPPVRVSDTLTAQIMSGLPPVKKRNSWMVFIRRHPAVSVAVVFATVMFGSFMSMWNDDTNLMVKGSNLQDVVIEGDTVTVPQGHTVKGDLVVQRGKLKVEGEVTGNLTVIDGSLNLASTAHISGHVTQVNEALSWVWYKVGEYVGMFSH
ncbi:zf-HC2 domain-containing protein [Paenibacillus alginolyticus]|uniref:Anti-sigma-W factor RsiW n=1 Tax=Paenibacillus alginolyticus TaxID=59839 RepID=A0ABT4GIV5_9BACL|nr:MULTISPECIES: zf-HC2 domain-containing protein [Paenibacillus]MCY9666555.1 zf-HC2 domain-containing protein [Paenibacillus alginolyticus]MCY9696135.1 zf-HC2 domain-containing protein [Paenibacillus alginolyticus]MEC0143288.1 zf-HC2 domain-containing protein [Paenibacillus alginolyticus]NRF95815.1 zf-HC2 domain-containing protein [Paenibacillus frigoriresistens]